MHLRPQKKKPAVLWADGPSKQGRSVGTFKNFFFFFLVAKWLPWKTLNFPKFWHFLRKILEKMFSYFRKFFAKFSVILIKNGWFYLVLANYEKKIYQNGKCGSAAPVKQGFLFSWPKLQFIYFSSWDGIKQNESLLTHKVRFWDIAKQKRKITFVFYCL